MSVDSKKGLTTFCLTFRRKAEKLLPSVLKMKDCVLGTLSENKL